MRWLSIVMVTLAVAASVVCRGDDDDQLVVPPVESVGEGRFHVIAIGIDAYEDQELQLTHTAVNAASAVVEVLTQEYGVDDVAARLLIDGEATEGAILMSLYRLADVVDEEDRVLVYFAGLQLEAEVGGKPYSFWLPWEARGNAPETWIDSDAVAKALSAMPARQVLLVCDGVLKGDRFSPAPKPAESEKAPIQEANTMARRALATPLCLEDMEVEGQTLSYFTAALVKTLKSSPAPTVTATQVHALLVQHIIASAASQASLQNLPVSLTMSGHAPGGDFVFTRSAAPSEKPLAVGPVDPEARQKELAAKIDRLRGEVEALAKELAGMGPPDRVETVEQARELRTKRQAFEAAQVALQEAICEQEQDAMAASGRKLEKAPPQLVAGGDEQLGMLAARYGVSVKHLMSVNGLHDTRLQPGQVLYISESPSDPKVDLSGLQLLPHYCDPGDTLKSVAQMYNSRVEWIRAANAHVKSDRDILPGLKLMVPVSEE